jgi:hypothetical protein
MSNTLILFPKNLADGPVISVGKAGGPELALSLVRSAVTNPQGDLP